MALLTAGQPMHTGQASPLPRRILARCFWERSTPRTVHGSLCSPCLGHHRAYFLRITTTLVLFFYKKWHQCCFFTAMLRLHPEIAADCTIKALYSKTAHAFHGVHAFWRMQQQAMHATIPFRDAKKCAPFAFSIGITFQCVVSSRQTCGQVTAGNGCTQKRQRPGGLSHQYDPYPAAPLAAGRHGMTPCRRRQG